MGEHDKHLKQETIECSVCNKTIPVQKGLTIGGRVVCTKCMKKVTIPILVALAVVVTIAVLVIIFGPK